MKSRRHEKIIELIGKEQIETQEELVEKLAKAGFPVTQATISRDIRELRLTKVAGAETKQYYTILPAADSTKAEKYIRVLREGFVSMDVAQNILVVKTVEGMAMAVAAALDNLQFDEIAGWIAGDDTIFCAIRSAEETVFVRDKLKIMLQA